MTNPDKETFDLPSKEADTLPKPNDEPMKRRLPPRVIDRTSEYLGKTFVLIGARAFMPPPSRETRATAADIAKRLANTTTSSNERSR